MKNFIFSRDGQFSVYGGILVAGDIEAYRVGVDMGTDTSGMAAMAVCQENGEYSGNYELRGNRIFVTLANSMYSTPGYITVRLAVSKGDSVITAKEIRFRVAPPNNSDSVAENESGTLDTILTSVTRAEAAAQEVLSNIKNYALKADTYTKDEIDNTISSVYKYKGSLMSYGELPPKPSVGDVYNINSACVEKAYGVNITKISNELLVYDEATDYTIHRLYIYVEDTSVFKVGDYIRVFDENGVWVGGFSVLAKNSEALYADYGRTITGFIDSQGLYEICRYLYNKHAPKNSSDENVGINKVYFFAGIPEAQDSIDININAGENVVWNGYEWDNLGGTVDLSGYYTKDEVDGKTTALSMKINDIFSNYVSLGAFDEAIAPITLEINDLKANTYTKTEIDSKISSDLSSYSTTAQVSAMIESAIGIALGGEY